MAIAFAILRPKDSRHKPLGLGVRHVSSLAMLLKWHAVGRGDLPVTQQT